MWIPSFLDHKFLINVAVCVCVCVFQSFVSILSFLRYFLLCSRREVYTHKMSSPQRWVGSTAHLTDVTADVTQPMMQALALLPEKIRQRRRVRQRILDPGSPRAAFANPKYGSTSRNFIFRVMATRKVSPAPIPASPPYQEMQEGEKRSVVVVARSTYSAKLPVLAGNG